MKEVLEKHFKDERLHHAYLVSTDTLQATVEQLEEILAGLGVSTLGNPDYFKEDIPQVTIDIARRLSTRQAQKPFGDRQFFVIGTGDITREAQNALLKTFEEPTPGTHFFIIVPKRLGILPTLASRCHSLEHEDQSEPSTISIDKFVAATPGKRVELMKPLIETKDKHLAVVFLNELETYLANEETSPEVIRSLWKARDYLSDKGSSLKMLLEHVALLPIDKE